MDSCNSSPGPDLPPDVAEIMDEVFDSALLQEVSLPPASKDKSKELIESKETNNNMAQGNNIAVNIIGKNSDISYENNEIFDEISEPNNKNFNSVICETDLMDMDIELEYGIVIIGHAAADSAITKNCDEIISPEKNQTYIFHDDETINSKENAQKEEKKEKRISRKRVRHPDAWKQHIRKNKREAGEEYMDIKGNLHEKRKIKFGCIRENCKYKCRENIKADKRQQIHEAFWKLSDAKKNNYYSEHVKRTLTARKRTKSAESKKAYSLFYYFNIDNVAVRVCKNFFLETLDISAQRIQYFFKHVQNTSTNVPRSPLKGKNVKKYISNDKKNGVRAHIESFPSVESHYCRANSKMTYLEGNLNVSKMYSLYCQTTEDPVKMHMYKKIFETEFNIGFHKPKKDLCEKCVQYTLNNNKTQEEVTAHENHIRKKKEGKEERDKDRKNRDKLTAIITFDMENVFCLPKTNVGTHFYKQKLICYNLTAHCNLNNVVYCSVWNEGICGRGGVHLANSMIKILKEVVKDNPAVEHIILWSDSCIPQNKNSFMSLALQTFLDSTNNIQTIEQKFGEPGHGNIQEIDCAHSVIEKHIRSLDIHSPLGLLKILKSIPKGKLTFKILQMRPIDYLDYQIVASRLQYKKVPYTQVKQLLYKRNENLRVYYKNRFPDDFTVVHINKESTLRKQECCIEGSKLTIIPKPSVNDMKSTLNNTKKSALQSMLNTMPDEDRNFYLQTFLRKSSSGQTVTKVTETDFTAGPSSVKKQKPTQKKTTEPLRSNKKRPESPI